ncbi:M48 family metalloprotease [Patescibacteria group bacterium]|nr:M48 family metalloprotease [Patescibacteria group bacterium]
MSVEQPVSVERKAPRERPPFRPDLIRQARAAEALYAAEFGLLPDHHPVTQEAQNLLTALPGSHETQVRISLDADSPNAFVLPNGTIVVNRGLLRLVDTQELRVVLAHELAHHRRRHIQEFTLLQEELRTGQKTMGKTLELFGKKRFGEWEADIGGIIEGDEAGTHPAALRTLMQKFEAWRIQSGQTESGVVHGKEIERIVNAGLATQAYDFESDFETRTPLSAETRAFAAAELPPRFPDSGDCEREEAERLLADKTTLELLVCLRKWRKDDRVAVNGLPIDRQKEEEEKKELSEPVEEQIVPVVGEGYEVGIELLRQRVEERSPDLSKLQQDVLLRVLLESIAEVREVEIEDGPFQAVLDGLASVETEAELEEVRQILVPETFEGLGVCLPNGMGVSNFIGAVLRTANEASLYEENGAFDVDQYLAGSTPFLEQAGVLMREHSLTGAAGFVVSDTILDELLVNIKTKDTAVPVVRAVLRLQDLLRSSGLPPQPARIHHAIQRQHYYKKGAFKEEFTADQASEMGAILGGNLEDALCALLYQSTHPILRGAPVPLFGYFADSAIFAHESSRVFTLPDGTVGNSSVSAETIHDTLFLRSRDLSDIAERSDWTKHVFKVACSHPTNPEERTNRVFYDMLLDELSFKTVFQTPDAFSQFCEALNRLQDELRASEPQVRIDLPADFTKIYVLAFTYLLNAGDQVAWLPADREEAKFELVRCSLQAPGSVVSRILTDTRFLDALVKDSPVSYTAALKLFEVVSDTDAQQRNEVKQDSILEKRIEHDPVLNFLKCAQDALANAVGTIPLPSKQKEVLDQLRRLDELVFRRRSFLPVGNLIAFGALDSEHDQFVGTIIEECVTDLTRSEDRAILLSLTSRMKDPLLRARVVEQLVRLELDRPGATVQEGIDLLYQNPHVRPVALPDLRSRFLDERVDQPDQIAAVRNILVRRLEQDLSSESVGIYALLERLEKRKDSLGLLKMLYSYNISDKELKTDIFQVLRDEVFNQKPDRQDEVAVLQTDAFLGSLEHADDLVRHGLVRKLLIGEQGLLHTKADRKRLFAYLLDSAVDARHSPPELLETVKEVLDVVAEVVETDVLFFAIAPFLQERILRTPSTPTAWEDILSPLYTNKYTVKKTLATVMVMQGATSRKDDEFFAPSDHAYRRHLRTLGISYDKKPDQVTAALPRLETMIVRIAESLGADGVRLLQVLGQYVEDLPPELEEAFLNANDNVRGQSKLTAEQTARKRAPGLQIVRFGRRLGGGSLMSAYDADVLHPSRPDPIRVALKVLAPNAEFVSTTIERSLEKVADALVERNPDRYLPAKLALQDISAWIQADVNDTRYAELDPAFRETHDGFRIPGVRYSLSIPESFVVPGGAKANKHIKLEEQVVDGVTVNRRFADPGQEDLPQAMAVIAKKFAHQLVDGVMHSDVHPGNYLLFQRGGQDSVAMIDRSYYLELDAKDQALVLGLTQDGESTEDRIRHLRTYFAHDLAASKQDEDFWTSLAGLLEQNDRTSLRQVMARLRAVGVEVPLKLTLLFKNVMSVDRMSRRAGHASFRAALAYLPPAEPSGTSDDPS